MQTPTPGQQLASIVCATKVIVVRAGEAAARLTCGGLLMVAPEEVPEPLEDILPGCEGPTAIGKRYVDAEDIVEVLCTQAGAGVLAIDGTPLTVKAAKPLPSSD